jgi:hypothetical protein
MAAQPHCDMCEMEPASVMQSNLSTGDTVAIGDGCLIPFYLTVIQAILEGMPADVREEYGTQLKPVIDQLVPSAGPAKPAGPAKRRDRKQAVARVEQRGADPDAIATAEGDFGPGQPFSADSAASDD